MIPLFYISLYSLCGLVLIYLGYLAVTGTRHAKKRMAKRRQIYQYERMQKLLAGTGMEVTADQCRSMWERYSMGYEPGGLREVPHDDEALLRLLIIISNT